MKVLLIGEYSGLHTNLAKGLRILGHEVTTVSDGDNFKNFPRNIDTNGNSNNPVIFTLKRIYKEIKAAFNTGYDVIQFINPLVFSRFGPCITLNRYLAKNNKKAFLLAAGDDYFFWDAYRKGKYKYSPHQAFLERDIKQERHVWESERLKKINLQILDHLDGIIPCAVEYQIAYQDNHKLKEIIPFPMDVNTLPYKENRVSENGKIKILHGVQQKRKGFKGTDLIDKAMEGILDKYFNVEYLRPENVPYNKYVELLNSANIVIDQVNGFSPAMNALASMAMGKVLLGGAETEFLKSMNLTDAPVINIEPNVDHIFSQIEKIILISERLTDMGRSARQYVEKYHNHVLIAQKYVDVWSS